MSYDMSVHITKETHMVNLLKTLNQEGFGIYVYSIVTGGLIPISDAVESGVLYFNTSVHAIKNGIPSFPERIIDKVRAYDGVEFTVHKRAD